MQTDIIKSAIITGQTDILYKFSVINIYDKYRCRQAYSTIQYPTRRHELENGGGMLSQIFIIILFYCHNMPIANIFHQIIDILPMPWPSVANTLIAGHHNIKMYRSSGLLRWILTGSSVGLRNHYQHSIHFTRSKNWQERNCCTQSLPIIGVLNNIGEINENMVF